MKQLACLILILVTSGCHSARWNIRQWGQPFGTGKHGGLFHRFSTHKNACPPQGCPPAKHACGTSGGCFANGVDSCFGCYPDELRTRRMATRLALQNLPPRASCPDFKAGFEQAFIDIAMGSCGDVPAVPPHDYCGVNFRTAYGQQRVANWFEGYAVGAEIARSYQDRFLDVATSGSYNCGPYEDGHLP